MQYDLSKIDKPLGELPMTVQWDLVEYAESGGKVQRCHDSGEWIPCDPQWVPSFAYRADPAHYTPPQHHKVSENMKIEKNIPIPTALSNRKRSKSYPKRRKSYPFQEMEIGDSFQVDEADAASSRAAAYQYGKRHGREFATCALGDKLRIWRIK